MVDKQKCEAVNSRAKANIRQIIILDHNNQERNVKSAYAEPPYRLTQIYTFTKEFWDSHLLPKKDTATDHEKIYAAYSLFERSFERDILDINVPLNIIVYCEHADRETVLYWEFDGYPLPGADIREIIGPAQ